MTNDTEMNPSMSIDDATTDKGSNNVLNTAQAHNLAAEQIEKQLSSIISAAQQIAAISEELMREFTTYNMSFSQNQLEPVKLRKVIHAAAVAPLMLSATQQQLDSLNSLLQIK
jgi:hypothetical protein